MKPSSILRYAIGILFLIFTLQVAWLGVSTFLIFALINFGTALSAISILLPAFVFLLFITILILPNANDWFQKKFKLNWTTQFQLILVAVLIVLVLISSFFLVGSTPHTL